MNFKKTVAGAALIVLAAVLLGLAANFPLFQKFLKGEFRESLFPSEKYPGIILIGLAEAEELFVRGSAFFIDSRPKQKFSEGRILNAVNIPLEDNKKKLRSSLNVPLEKTIVVYCDGGDCQESLALAKVLHSQGYKNIRVFTGGWAEWVGTGRPTAKGHDPQ
jgi:rhodanese-related sulfurtransferase